MSDRYQDLIRNPIGQFVVTNLGLPNPPVLERYQGGPLVDGTVLRGSASGDATTPDGMATEIDRALTAAGIDTVGVRADGRHYKGLLFDATGIDGPDRLVELQAFFTPVLRQLRSCGRVVVIGRPPEKAADARTAAAQRALEGFTRSLAKEVGQGSTANLVLAARGAETSMRSTLEFLLSPKSAYVSGQVLRLGTASRSAAEDVEDPSHPLAGKVALVTGASRGLGAADVAVLARDGATVVGLDVPGREDEVRAVVEPLGGGSLTLDVTAADAPRRIADHLAEHYDGVDVIVHNAGVTRDKRLRNMTAENFSLVVDISVGAPQRITAELLDRGLVRSGGRIVGVASIAGIAGNNGQTNYGAAKAGVIGWVSRLGAELAEDRITANAVAPGFIETDMVGTIPLALREAGRRMNSLSQGGQPVDVAEAIGFLAHPGSAAISGSVLRVCGQSLLGA